MAGRARDRGNDGETAAAAEGSDGNANASAAVTAASSKVPFLGMFRHADCADAALMAVGAAAAVANGMSEPLMTVVFAAVIECFGAGDDATVLHRVGKTVALVGESGSGKSIIIALLERFYDPDSGTISLDGAELKKLKLIWLRDQMGLVSQEPVLFNDTIHANIAYGKQGEVSEDEIFAAAKAANPGAAVKLLPCDQKVTGSSSGNSFLQKCRERLFAKKTDPSPDPAQAGAMCTGLPFSKAANAHEFISSLPKGHSTTVGERGTQLSGGQKQRVAIARAILKDPRILLLDEATSALDAEAERIVQDALDQVMVSRTTIVVAHRLSTIKGADIIAVIKDGKVAEKGKHESLVGIKGGVYASLVELHSKTA